MREIRSILALFAILAALFVGVPSSASQVPAHAYAALHTKEIVPERVRKIIENNLEAYLIGSSGPDIAYTAHYVQLGAAGVVHLETFPAGTEGHGDNLKEKSRSGDIIVNMLKLAKTDQERAFALGWLTHYCMDNAIHPLVNKHGGYYVEDSTRHKHIEMVECEHTFQRAESAMHDLCTLKLSKTVLPAVQSAKHGPVPIPPADITPEKLSNVPAVFLNSAFAATFPTGGNSEDYKAQMRPVPTSGHYQTENIQVPPAFIGEFLASADNVRICSESMLAVHRGTTYEWWGHGEFALALKGPPPTPEEYERLMHPLRIDEVRYRPPASASLDDTTGYLEIYYIVNDLRLFKLFCEDWNDVVQLTINDCANCMASWDADPAAFTLPNLNLNIGAEPYDPNTVWPGRPNIFALKATVDIKNSRGEPVKVIGPSGYKDWYRDGEWVWIPLADQANAEIKARWRQTTRVMASEKVWGGRAGKILLSVPFEIKVPGEFDVDVRLWLADFARQDDKPDGIEDHFHGKVGVKPPPKEEPAPRPPAPAGRVRFNAKLFNAIGEWNRTEDRHFSGTLAVDSAPDGKVAFNLNADARYSEGGKKIEETLAGNNWMSFENGAWVGRSPSLYVRSENGLVVRGYEKDDTAKEYVVTVRVLGGGKFEGDVRGAAGCFSHMTFQYPNPKGE